MYSRGELGLCSYHLGEVNLVQQSFFADIGIHMSWLKPALKGRKHLDSVTDLELDDPNVHVPVFFIENRLDVRPVNKALLNTRSKDPDGVVRWEQVTPSSTSHRPLNCSSHPGVNCRF